MARVWNFSAGPAVLPEPVLEQVRDELLDWHGTGMGVMEMSHRGKAFTGIIEAAEADLRALLGVPANYRVLFLQGGATQQFSQIPLNLLDGASDGRAADYVVTGTWSKKALTEAQRLGRVRCAASTEADAFSRLPEAAEYDLSADAAYVHLCTNETIHGVEFPADVVLPTAAPLVADMSSHLLSRPFDVSRFGLIYGGAQKNIGPAGLTLVLVRDDLTGRAAPQVPGLQNYAVEAANGSMLNTPPTFAIYVAGLVFRWLQELGGLSAIARINADKASALYACIDRSAGFYRNPVQPACRSQMNVPFRLADENLNASFLAESEAAGLFGLKGHKSFGGMRASIYNAMPLAGVSALVEFMDDFARRRG
ncbi:3-phosphoserine/phosphohydroxythreonine transaminase [Rhodocyclus tenuis]|uniref:Phosphoserine aminotransferase n=1 Tax=Rhodocyclus gracilis TaxID=2929842 RepID=A0ABX0WDV5_9RHOO|nr:3-phosphoserine/phosphohydroxythreonine transaminase [Rhodocyclus gracilis]NJA87880.1 3-phosphoserine/phosphohydroxythreonine transaminase [Rhodocyclus gracilis]